MLVAAFTDNLPAWLARGWMFGEEYSKKRIRTVREFQNYMNDISKASGMELPKTPSYSWNHGDPSSRNIGYADGIVYIWDFGRTVYGPSWIDGHAIRVYDTSDYTSEMTKAFWEHGIGIKNSDFMLIGGFRSWYATRGLFFDLAQQ